MCVCVSSSFTEHDKQQSILKKPPTPDNKNFPNPKTINISCRLWDAIQHIKPSMNARLFCSGTLKPTLRITTFEITPKSPIISVSADMRRNQTLSCLTQDHKGEIKLRLQPQRLVVAGLFVVLAPGESPLTMQGSRGLAIVDI